MQKFGAFQSQKLSQINILDSDAGEIYAKKLTNFVEKRLKSERAASIDRVHCRSIVSRRWGRVLILPAALDGDGDEVNEWDEVNEVLSFPNKWRGLNKSGERVAGEGGEQVDNV
ncbi:hypothetical protein WN944_006498 [Citrus x changshan-huyou]|uniref:Uncharacterized protein n=1 Tax=Citrus x changshan-huyou TaxID=2935761 RepID=A0AAP0MPE9_9ROSI